MDEPVVDYLNVIARRKKKRRPDAKKAIREEAMTQKPMRFSFNGFSSKKAFNFTAASRKNRTSEKTMEKASTDLAAARTDRTHD